MPALVLKHSVKPVTPIELKAVEDSTFLEEVQKAFEDAKYAAVQESQAADEMFNIRKLEDEALAQKPVVVENRKDKGRFPGPKKPK
jgi:hypothetical protein